MKKSLTLVLAVAMIAAASISMAQGGGGGQGGGRGQGRMMGGRMQSGLNLLRRKDVQTDLKMTAEQIKQADEAQQAMMEEMRNNFQNGGGQGGGDREAMQKMMEEMQKKQQAQVEKILDKTQQARLKQIGWQLQGNRAVADAELQKLLNFTDKQKADLKALQAKQQEANNALREKQMNGELDRDAAQEARTKNDKAMDEEIAKLLTDAQKADLKKALGEPFKADPNEQGGRRIPPAA